MRIFQIDAFTSRRYSGNPATVVLDAENLSDERYQQIAREFAHAETAFALSPTNRDHDIYVRFFNSRKEAAFVGHATLAVHHVLLSLGLRGFGVHRQRSQQGTIAVTAARGSKPPFIGNGRADSKPEGPGDAAANERPFFEFRQTAAELDAPLAPDYVVRILRALGLSPEQLHPGLPAVVARKGSSRLLLPVASPQILSLIKPDFGSLLELGSGLGIEGYFPFAIQRETGTARTYSRMFCPALGIPEDPVSGNAHAMLATYLWNQPLLRPFADHFTGFQGEHVNRPGTVSVRLEVEKQDLMAAYIGGEAVTVSEGRLSAV
jgi:predicted PhzF superfamily epimerase YddE/YHI9